MALPSLETESGSELSTIDSGKSRDVFFDDKEEESEQKKAESSFREGDEKKSGSVKESFEEDIFEVDDSEDSDTGEDRESAGQPPAVKGAPPSNLPFG